MPGWAWVVISIAVGVGVMAVASILAITFLGQSAESKFSTVGSAVGDNRVFTTGDADTYGDDARLDALWDRCEDGSGSACDSLFWSSPVDSDYEEFGHTCGRRFTKEESPFACADEIGE